MEGKTPCSRARTRGADPDLTVANVPTTLDHSAEIQRALEESRERRVSRLSVCERRVELAIGGGFVFAALALLLGGGPSPSLGAMALVVLVFAAASRVTFDVGACYAAPSQIALVPMLFLVPAQLVPLCVAAALMLAKVPDVALGRLPASRVLLALGDSWFALGPAVVFAVAEPGAPNGADWAVYLVALVAQFAVDAGCLYVREALNGSPGTREQLRASMWVYLVDALLAPVGLAIAFGAVGRPWLVLLELPLAALILVFAREREARIDNLIELRRAYRGMALVLGNVVESDDEYTGVHCHEVEELAVLVAHELGLDTAARRNVAFAALLHDVGKIAVPKSIINKPGPLDEDEWVVMRRHTIEGQRMLEEVGGFMREVGQIVRASHEAFDGSGYPDGLAGQRIPFEARIIAACDAFNAMTTDRSYRAARSVAAAIAELRRCAGTQFDPRVVAALVAVVERDGGPVDDADLLPDPASFLLQRAP
jgi:putative nucleotidyltransferase with HDIG domain